MENLSLAQLKDFAIVLLAFGGFIVLCGSVIKTVKDWLKPHDDMNKWKADVDKKLASDNVRLTEIDKGVRVLVRGNLALISHAINGNSDDKLKASQQEITNWLIDR